jgi:hypothetical protein
MVYGIGPVIVQILSSLGYAWAPMLINAATSGGWEANMNAMLENLPDPGLSTGGVVAVVITVIVALAIFVQVLILLFVAGVLPIMVELWANCSPASTRYSPRTARSTTR